MIDKKYGIYSVGWDSNVVRESSKVSLWLNIKRGWRISKNLLGSR